MTVDVLLLCGPAGVGKSSVAYEVSARLAAADVSHALIDCDELDRVHPWPPPGLPSSELARRNLAAVWRTFADVGHRRLIVVGVFASLADELPWVRDAVPGCTIRVVRLSASRDVLRRRVERREIGSGAAAQLTRTWNQLDAIAAGDPSLAVAPLDTGHLDVPAAAAAVLQLLPWPSSGPAPGSPGDYG